MTISTGVFACDCQPYDSIMSAYHSANVVFEGKVINIDTAIVSDTINAISSTNSEPHIEVILEKYLMVKLSITRLFKGDQQNTIITIFTPAAGSACGIQFTPGISYLVYGYTWEFNLIDGGNANTMQNSDNKTSKVSGYSTSLCTRTTKETKNEIAELKRNKLIP